MQAGYPLIALAVQWWGGGGKEEPAQSHLRICPVKEQEREGTIPTFLLYHTEEKPLVPGSEEWSREGRV